METKQWWEVLEVVVSSTLMPSSYIIRCKHCCCEYETYSLFELPSKCQECECDGVYDAD